MQHRDVQKGVFQAEVLSNQQIRRCYWRLNLLFDAFGSRLFQHVLPGQFLEMDLNAVSLPESKQIPEHLKDAAAKPVLLRRPFSFSDVIEMPSEEGSTIKVEILYCVLGPATLRMMSLKKGDSVSLLGPLGNGFTIPEKLSTALLIAGGMGSPPILHLAGYLKSRFPSVAMVCFVGSKNSADLPFTIKIGPKKELTLEEFERFGVSPFIATDDGSAGFDGYITDCLRHWLEKNTLDPANTLIFACGPEAMLAGTARLAKDFSLPCLVSMERMMACGIGLCQSCAVEMKTGTNQTRYQLCCKDGPVFDADKVVFRI